MSAPITDTARHRSQPAPVTSEAAPLVTVRTAPARRAVQERRRRLRRQRRVYAWVGIAVLAAFFFATMVVLDVVR